MKKTFHLLAIAALPLLALAKGPGDTVKPAKETADKVYINGKIITVDAKNSTAQAVAVKAGKILAVGSVSDINKLKDGKTIVVDLGGKTVIPGLIDGHSHFMSLEWTKTANVAAPPVGPVKTIADLVAELKKYKAEKNIPDGEWINGFGYDVDQLAEKRHPTKDDLDGAFPNNPVVITHVSGHMAVANSAALKSAGIDSTTKDPAGGIIVRKDGSNEPAGLLQERAQGLVRRNRPSKTPTLDEQLKTLKDQQLYYASQGITTAQDGSTSFESLQLLKQAADRGELLIDIETLPSYGIIDKVLGNPEFKYGVLDKHLKLNGFKFMSDGSPQGKTAYFGQPYLTKVPGCDSEVCRGFPVTTQEQFNAAVKKGFENNIQVFVHCNGDAAIDMYIEAVENANRELKTTSTNRRPVVIHSQFVRPDQLDKYKQLGMLPACFTNHTFFWGDVHVQNLGEKRAFFSSPLKTALKKGIIATNHTDFPVTPVNQLFLLWTAVNRQSRSGKTIGPDERLTPIEGLRTITINGAYEYFEEATKGSIEPGKLADLVVLSDNPLTIDPQAIKDLVVLETIKEGKTIYKR
ncbi:amidohydrolase [Spirosoma sp. KCTC 42546]|uniref:amidohydrolase n=1 Tax=Spirosoma sp. KCTC 42546 TaxID=2520506 RepID=UPI0011577C0C|nr:amidohydrolase [Spirosoma sp. KCTC 42546]QDK81092.1 amidohydrolase [Spirosoma sp. KCTC 42546]